jgi:hypothetical protein
VGEEAGCCFHCDSIPFKELENGSIIWTSAVMTHFCDVVTIAQEECESMRMSGHNRLADIDDVNFVQEPEQIKFTQVRMNLKVA